MSKTIWKFTVPITDSPALEVPEGAEFLTAQVDPEWSRRLNVWALLEPSRPSTLRELQIYGTGFAMPDDPGRYIATAVDAKYGGVWHLFESAH